MAPANQGTAGRGHRECDVSRRASGCSGKDSHYEAAPDAGHDRLRPPGLAISRTPRTVMFPGIRSDGPSLGVEGDRPPQRPRLGVGKGAGSHGSCQLTRVGSPAATSFLSLGCDGPNSEAWQTQSRQEVVWLALPGPSRPRTSKIGGSQSPDCPALTVLSAHVFWRQHAGSSNCRRSGQPPSE